MFNHLAIDWGSKKCGLAIGNSGSALVLPKEIVITKDLFQSIQVYCEHYPITTIVLSENKSFHFTDTLNSRLQKQVADEIAKLFPAVSVVLFSERGTTRLVGKNHDHQSAAELLKLYFAYHQNHRV